MSRAATYQFGAQVHRVSVATVDTGLGKALASRPLTLIAPTDTVPDERGGATLTIGRHRD